MESKVWLLWEGKEILPIGSIWPNTAEPAFLLRDNWLQKYPNDQVTVIITD